MTNWPILSKTKNNDQNSYQTARHESILRTNYKTTKAKKFLNFIIIRVRDPNLGFCSLTIFISSTFSVLRPLYFLRFTSTRVLRLAYRKIEENLKCKKMKYQNLKEKNMKLKCQNKSPKNHFQKNCVHYCLKNVGTDNQKFTDRNL